MNQYTKLTSHDIAMVSGGASCSVTYEGQAWKDATNVVFHNNNTHYKSYVECDYFTTWGTDHEVFNVIHTGEYWSKTRNTTTTTWLSCTKSAAACTFQKTNSSAP